MKTSSKLKKILAFSAVLMLIAVLALTFVSCGSDKGKVEGEKKITVEVINKAGEHKSHEITTTGTTLADALLESKLVEGDTTEYGLYINSVDGEVADYSVDQSYWAVSQDGEALMTGASSTNIADGDHYELTYTISQ